MNRRGFLTGAISIMAVAAILKGKVSGFAEETWLFGLAPIKQEGTALAYDYEQVNKDEVALFDKRGIFKGTVAMSVKDDAPPYSGRLRVER